MYCRRFDRERMAGCGNAQPPMQFCTKADFSPVSCASRDDIEIKRTTKMIRRLDASLTICHDWSTTGDTLVPGYHVYREHNGKLCLVTSCQYNMDAIWPTGGPRKPGPWLVGALQRLARPQEDIMASVERREQRAIKERAEVQSVGFREIAKAMKNRKLVDRIKRKQRLDMERTPTGISYERKTK